MEGERDGLPGVEHNSGGRDIQIPPDTSSTPSSAAASQVATPTDTASEQPGSSYDHPIDLTTEDQARHLPPPPQPTQRYGRPVVPLPGISRRPSDCILPRWQPDHEVSHCPVCQSPFTFWYRKHHCRKCGRVVCSNCSPHRITMPRQFIVRPPDSPTSLLDLGTSENSPATPTTPLHLWGGEEVRVCNPCVPDPNLSPPPPPYQHGYSPDRIPEENWRFPNERALPPAPRQGNNYATLPARPPMPPSPGSRRLSNSNRTAMLPPPPPIYPIGHSRRSSQDPFNRSQRTGTFPTPTHVRELYGHSSLSSSGFFPPRAAPGSGAGLSSSLNGPAPTHLPAPLTPYRNRPLIDIDDHTLRTPPPPRRQVAEEDECPVCGEELPPCGANGETADRERHVEDCIASHSYSSTPPRPTQTAPVADALPGTSPARTSSAPIPTPARPPVPGSSVSSSSSTPLRHRRLTGGRMLVYRATEKDCVAEDGERAECVICFEEFETGDEMGRLECLCRFHGACIRRWWGTKGVGSCPTHQLHD